MLLGEAQWKGVDYSRNILVITDTYGKKIEKTLSS